MTERNSPNHTNLFEVPLDQDFDGEVLIPSGEATDILHPKAAYHILRSEHPYYASHEVNAVTERISDTQTKIYTQPGFRAELQEPFKGYPSMDLSTRRDLLLTTLNSLASALKASGRVRNRYDTKRIASNIGISPGEVNDHGAAMQPEHERRANEAFGKLMMREEIAKAGLDVSDLPRVEQFRGKYFGSKDAARDNARFRRTLSKGQKSSKRAA